MTLTIANFKHCMQVSPISFLEKGVNNPKEFYLKLNKYKMFTHGTLFTKHAIHNY